MSARDGLTCGEGEGDREGEMRLAEHLLSLSAICKHGRMSRQRRLGMSASITSGGGYWDSPFWQQSWIESYIP